MNSENSFIKDLGATAEAHLSEIYRKSKLIFIIYLVLWGGLGIFWAYPRWCLARQESRKHWKKDIEDKLRLIDQNSGSFINHSDPDSKPHPKALLPAKSTISDSVILSEQDQVKLQ